MTSRSKSPSPIAQKVYDALATYLRRDTSSFQDEDSLRDDLGLDSLMTIELLYEIESVFDLQIPDEDFGGLVTIGNVIAYIEKKKPAGPSRPLPKPTTSATKPKSASRGSKSSSSSTRKRR